MIKFKDTAHCGQGNVLSRCRDCRTDQAFRDAIKQHFEVPDDWDEVCPWGVTLKQLNKMPSPWHMLKNLLGTIKKAITHYIRYRKLLVPRAERKRRLAVCSTCEYFLPKTKRCRKCGCYMKAKVLFQAAECKLNLW